MAKRKDSSKKKRKGSGNGLLIAAVLLTILFLAGVMSLGALYYLEKNKEKPQTIPPKITEAAAVVTQTEEQTRSLITKIQAKIHRGNLFWKNKARKRLRVSQS